MSDIKQDFWKALDASPYVMVGMTGEHAHHIPMNAQLDKDADGAFWFFTATDNRLAGGGAAMVQFASKGHDLFACLAGTLRPETDRAVLDKLWNNGVAAWYPGGKDDPKLVLLRFDIGDAEIWTAEPGLKGMFKLATGMTMKEGELGQHARVSL
ncbi:MULTISPECIES: pyridoxamine 5'-phosphate oxidase family protein [Sphingopyxis]|uniref:pyridoxamine 5'-phosphate oxidase family protein n=1 Tax=Sphingopyxis TaxID=165697 RepID=UPI00086DF407|nr:MULTISPECIES: pyridoxamine 5'-phosphate oxidase family protein [Sphingopyxis]APW71850.1 general stress protein [Sphingopyxis granuli]AVA12577.1 general stress protein [Sphingopyxis sp. MG]ODU29680.1 MAG: general stress protein [Sphingopyxis sp. SCN 67-31]